MEVVGIEDFNTLCREVALLRNELADHKAKTETKEYTVREVAQILHRSEDCVRRKIGAHLLRARSEGGEWRISKADLEDYKCNPKTRKPPRVEPAMTASRGAA